MDRLKLFVFRPTLGQGGADRVTLTLLQELDRRHFHPTLVLTRREGIFLDDLPDDIPVEVLNAANVMVAFWPLAKLLRREKPDVLFSTASGANVTAVIAHRLAGIKGRVVLSERSVLIRGSFSWKKKAMLWLKRYFYCYADHITAVSQGVKTSLVEVLQLNPDSITVVHNPIVTPKVLIMADEPLEHPWFTGETPVILSVGRLVPEKDFQTLIRAFAAVRKRRPARLMILGEGPLRDELSRLVADLRLESDVCLPGFDKNPFNYMKQCTCFVLSSRFEGLPGVLIQAMACGAPVISTNCPSGPSEIITADGQDGLLTPVGDAQAVAEKILFLLDHPEKREAMGRHGRESAERFRVETVLARYVAAIEGTI